MAYLDRRIKRCPNNNCKAFEKTNYGPDLQYCSACGSELVFVCKKCGKKIEDLGSKHTICASCEADRQDRLDRVADVAKGVATGVGAVATAAAAVAIKAPGVAKQALDYVPGIVDTIKSLKP